MDERTKIPISWILPSLFSLGGVLCAGTFWVASVNNRLTSIEKKIDMINIATINKGINYVTSNR